MSMLLSYFIIDRCWAQEEGPSPEWHVPIEVGFSLLCAYGCLSYSALIFGHPAMLAP